MADVMGIKFDEKQWGLIEMAVISKLNTYSETSGEYQELKCILKRIYLAEYQKTQNTNCTKEQQPAAAAALVPPTSSTSSPSQGFRQTLPPRNTYQPQSADNAQSTPYISEPKARRFWAIYKKSNKPKATVDEMLKSMGFSNYKKITVDKYDELINWLQA